MSSLKIITLLENDLWHCANKRCMRYCLSVRQPERDSRGGAHSEGGGS